MLRARRWRTRIAAAPRRSLTAVVAVLVVLAPVAWMWADSLMPASYSIEDMGYPDFGGGPAAMTMAGPSVETLRAPPGPADVSVTLVARAQRVTLPSGRTFDGFTLNGTTPGPTIRARAPGRPPPRGTPPPPG